MEVRSIAAISRTARATNLKKNIKYWWHDNWHKLLGHKQTSWMYWVKQLNYENYKLFLLIVYRANTQQFVIIEIPHQNQKCFKELKALQRQLVIEQDRKYQKLAGRSKGSRHKENEARGWKNYRSQKKKIKS